MNKRQLQKQNTRLNLLQVARQQFVVQGFLNTTTSQIAAAAKVAHGTLFLHFPNKNMLILEILDTELNEINAQIRKVIAGAGDLEQMLVQYLEMLQEDEDIFSVIARELPFYPAELRRMILFRESIIRSYFHKMIEQGITAGRYRRLDPAAAVTFLFGTINYYLSLKTIYVKEGSVLKKFQHSIEQCFMALLICPKGEENE
ncbi:MAG TPA: TetR/AcrR family transcriptional regulator [Candidatus Cloacimonadota bacterium]|nr:TetR/AcrR family transcriptional regulator [Candidatus Cloacimonadota bacterium]